MSYDATHEIDDGPFYDRKTGERFNFSIVLGFCSFLSFSSFLPLSPQKRRSFFFIFFSFNSLVFFFKKKKSF